MIEAPDELEEQLKTLKPAAVSSEAFQGVQRRLNDSNTKRFKWAALIGTIAAAACVALVVAVFVERSAIRKQYEIELTSKQATNRQEKEFSSERQKTIDVAPTQMPSARPPPASQNLPGDKLGTVSTYWLAPFVSVTNRRLMDTSFTSVAWFTADGKILHEVAGMGVTVQPGYVEEYVKGTPTKFYAINADWVITLPEDAKATNTATPDGHVFVHETHPNEGEITLAIYVSGKLASTIGPFLQHVGETFYIGKDGSIVVPTWKTNAKLAALLVVCGPDGKERFRVGCDDPYKSAIQPIPALGGGAVLVAFPVQTNQGQSFTLYSASGKANTFTISPNARFIAWMPGANATALMQKSNGTEMQWCLVDCEHGKELWETPDLKTARVEYSIPTVALTKDYVLIGDLEYTEWADQKMPVRSIYALDAKSGNLVAHWLPTPVGQPCLDCGKILQFDQHTYLVGSNEFSEFKLDDIALHKGGWR